MCELDWQLYHNFRMEGACGKILDTENPTVVIKKVHRRKRAQTRTDSHGAEEQARIQSWAADACRKGGFTILFVPRAWDAEHFSYKMERIDTSNPLQLVDVKHHAVLGELKAFYEAARTRHLFPADYELYVQPDGRVAMVDFDKFATWNKDGTVRFPWGLELSKEQTQEAIPF